MTNITIHKHTAYYSLFDHESKLREYRKDNLEDMNAFVEMLIDELYKANAKQECWFEKYWECKKQLNQITDVLDGDVE